MRALVVFLLIIAAAAGGYIAGRSNWLVAIATSLAPAESFRIAARSTPPEPASVRIGRASAAGPAARLSAALDMAEGVERRREIRLAMNAWLAEQGAGALAAARADSRYHDVVDAMVRLAVQIYPEVLFDDPAILDGFPHRDNLRALAIHQIASYDPARARELIGEHMQSTALGVALLSSLDGETGAAETPTISERDPRHELQIVLEETDLSTQRAHLMALISRVARDDPAAAAALLDDVPPGAMRQSITWSLLNIWSRHDPMQAARWLVDAENSMETQHGLTQVAEIWGQNDLVAASAFANELSGSRRTSYLVGLAQSTARTSAEKLRGWISDYRDDPAYPRLVNAAAQQLASRNTVAALELVASLPPESRLASYRSILPMIAMQSPEAALDVLEGIDDVRVRSQVTPLVASMLARTDPKQALVWAREQPEGPLRDHAVAGVATFLAQTDPDAAERAIEEIGDDTVRKGPILMLLRLAPSDEAAVRLGQEHGYDREAVLSMRSQPTAVMSAGEIDLVN
jgi:hypothetical protein